MYKIIKSSSNIVFIVGHCKRNQLYGVGSSIYEGFQYFIIYMVGMSKPNTSDGFSFYPLFALYHEAFKNAKNIIWGLSPKWFANLYGVKRNSKHLLSHKKNRQDRSNPTPQTKQKSTKQTWIKTNIVLNLWF